MAKIVDINSRKLLLVKLGFRDKLKAFFLMFWYLPKRRFELFYHERQRAIRVAELAVHEKDCAENRHTCIIPETSGVGKCGTPFEYRRCKYCDCKEMYWIAIKQKQ